MTNEQQTFLTLAKEYELKQKELLDLKEHLVQAMQAVGMGTMLQDPTTGAVYKIIKPKGKFVYNDDIDYGRTALGEERAGTLSKKEAEAAGFVLSK